MIHETPSARRAMTGLLAGASAAMLASVALAQGTVDLSGETVEYVIPFSESGGSAQWANFYAPLLSEALPGNPTVVVRYRPGAGSPGPVPRVAAVSSRKPCSDEGWPSS